MDDNSNSGSTSVLNTALQTAGSIFGNKGPSADELVRAANANASARTASAPINWTPFAIGGGILLVALFVWGIVSGGRD